MMSPDSESSEMIVRRQPYTDEEDLKILNYILTVNQVYSLKGKAVWEDLAKLMDRTWQSLKERFLKIILPNLEQYNLTRLSRQRLMCWSAQTYQSRDLNTQSRRLYTAEEDDQIINYILQKKKRMFAVKGNMVWRELVDKQLIKDRTWQSLKNRYLKVIAKNFECYTTKDEARRLEEALRDWETETDSDDSNFTTRGTNERSLKPVASRRRRAAVGHGSSTPPAKKFRIISDDSGASSVLVKETSRTPGGSSDADNSDEAVHPRRQTYLVAKDSRASRLSGDVLNRKAKSGAVVSDRQEHTKEASGSDEANKANGNASSPREIGTAAPHPDLVEREGPWIQLCRLSKPELSNFSSSSLFPPKSAKNPCHERRPSEKCALPKEASVDVAHFADSTATRQPRSGGSPSILAITNDDNTLDVYFCAPQSKLTTSTAIGGNEDVNSYIKRLLENRLDDMEVCLSDAETVIRERTPDRISGDEHSKAFRSNCVEATRTVSPKSDIQQNQDVLLPSVNPEAAGCVVPEAICDVSRGTTKVKTLKSSDTDENTDYSRQDDVGGLGPGDKFVRFAAVRSDEEYSDVEALKEHFDNSSGSDRRPDVRSECSELRRCICRTLSPVPAKQGHVIFDSVLVGFRNGCVVSRRKNKRNYDPFLPFP